METARDSCQTAVHTGLGSVRNMASSDTGNLSTIILELTKIWRRRVAPFPLPEAPAGVVRELAKIERLGGWLDEALVGLEIVDTGAQEV